MVKRAKLYLLKYKIRHFVPFCATEATVGVRAPKQVQTTKYAKCPTQYKLQNVSLSTNNNMSPSVQTTKCPPY